MGSCHRATSFFVVIGGKTRPPITAAGLLPDMPILSYPHAAKPYFIIEVTICDFKK